MNTPPKLIVVDGKVVNHEQMERYWRDRNFLLERIRRGNFYAQRDKEWYTQPEEASPQAKVIVKHITVYDRESRKPKSKWG